MRKGSLKTAKAARGSLALVLTIVSLFLASQTSGGSVTYVYDDLDRLIQEAYDNGTVVSYAYDGAGNRLSREVLNPAGPITLISPDGGESWAPGSTETIYWTYDKTNAGLSAVEIELIEGSGPSTVISPSASIGSGGSGSFDWAIPASQPPGNDYKVKISSTTDATISDTSENTFTIVNPPSAISMDVPAAGETWTVGSRSTISWSYSANSGTLVQLDLLKGGTVVSSISQAAPIGTGGRGFFYWSPTVDLVPGADYQIKATTLPGQTVSLSNSFIICGGLFVTSPNPGDTWQSGAQQHISWKCYGNPGPAVKIELMQGDALNTTITSSTPLYNYGSTSTGYDWQVPYLPAGSSYAVRVSSTSNSLYAGQSNISIAAPSITVIAPAGGESWQAGSAQTISWTSTGSPGSQVNIDLLNAGAVVSNIVSGYPIGDDGTGSYNWFLPSDLPSGSSYTIRITSVEDSNCQVTSNTFTVVATGFTFTSPQGGESWQAGTTQNIGWSYAGDPGSTVKIELLKSGQVNGTIAASALTGSSYGLNVDQVGGYAWTIPADQQAGADYAIRITSNTNGSYSIQSNNFSIVSTGITIISPNGGETWQAGATQEIDWSYLGNPGSAVEIDLLEAGTLNTTIAASVPIGTSGSGNYYWAVPANQPSGSDYTVRVTSTSNSSFTGASQNNFTISGIVVTSPSGGENWPPGSAQTITWTYSDNTGTTVNIDLLRWGQPLTPSVNIATGVSIGNGGSGTYSWTVPNDLSTGGGYSIKVSNAQYSGAGSYFSIKDPTIVLISPSDGDALQAGAPQTIQWTYAGNPGSTVNLELWNFSGLVNTIVDGASIGTGGSGSYAWTVPSLAAGQSGQGYHIVITCGSFSDDSGFFSIVPSVLTIYSPSGGENWPSGKNQLLSWNYTPNTFWNQGKSGSTVKIDLLKTGLVNTTIAASTPGLSTTGFGVYNWLIPANQPAGSDYAIRLSCTANSAFSSQSNSFTIAAWGITNVSLAGDMNWPAGSAHMILWNFTGDPNSMVKIELWKGGVFNTTVVASTTIGDPTSKQGLFSWVMPANQPPGSDYSIVVTSLSNGSVSGQSGLFNVTSPSVSVTMPASGASFPAGSIMNIGWNYSLDLWSSSVKIELLQQGAPVTTIAASVPVGTYGSGSFNWSIPGSRQPGSNYSVRVTNNRYSACSSQGGTFSIAAPTITVTSPSGAYYGSTYQAGSGMQISWNYTGDPGSTVQIDLLKSGQVNTAIAASVPTGVDGSGSYSWLIPGSQTPGSDYSVRVTSTRDNTISGLSNGAFTISSPTISVVTPSGGQGWLAASNLPISWSYSGDPGSTVKIELLKSGQLNTTIAASAPVGNNGSGSYSWPVPSNQAPGADYSIRVTSVSNNTISAISAGVFSIIAPSISISSPNGGESWQAGTTHAVSWSFISDIGNSVKIELLESGQVVSTIAASASSGNSGTGLGSYNWPIPVSRQAAADYSIRVTSTSNSACTSMSQNNFTITSASSTGSLTCAITPSAAALAGAWQVDGNGNWLQSGAIAQNLSAGSHTVTFEGIPGWNAPAPLQNVTVSAGQFTTVTGNYTPQTGSLKVTITPQDAVTAGAQWSVDGGKTWQASGTTVANVPVGSCTITFKDVPGWITPTAVNVTITKGVTATATGTYGQAGRLSVTINPAGAVAAGAQWSIDGGATWIAVIGTPVTLAVGTYTVTFENIAGWDRPAPIKNVKVSKGQTSKVTGVYAQQFGSLEVTITPTGITGAKWSVDGGKTRNAGGTTVSLPVGAYTVTFEDVSGWDTPAPVQNVAVSKGKLTKATGNYVRQTGSLKVTITPANLAGAKWSVDSGKTWNAGATTVPLTVGTYTVTFKSVSGWTTPAPVKNVQVLKGQTATVTGVYAQQFGSLQVTITPAGAVAAGAQWSVDGGKSWNGSGTTLTLPVGTYTLTFKGGIKGWTAPQPQSVTVSTGKTTKATGPYKH
jgi:YD repeat-containing protein